MQPAKRINIVSVKLVREGSVLYKERRVQSPADVDKLLISECSLYLRNLSKDIFGYMEGFSRFLSNRLFEARFGEERDDCQWLKIQEKTTESAL
ncbi:hypothetical protein [Anoxybacillus flavithermus]